MSAKQYDLSVNRHGLVGDFATFAPKRLTAEDLRTRLLLKTRGQLRASVALARAGEYSLVRYHLGSNELRQHLESVGAGDWSIDGDRSMMTAVFGVLDACGEPGVILDVIDDPQDGGPRLSFVFAAAGREIPPEVILQCLSRLDVPARAGADLQLAALFDVYWSEAAGGWEMRAERNLVKVTFVRHCFGTTPKLTEAVDVFVLPSPKHDLSNSDADKAYLAQGYYRTVAWEELERMPRGDRPGFSSWLHAEEAPRIVKVLDTSLDNEIARLNGQSADAELESEPAASSYAP